MVLDASLSMKHNTNRCLLFFTIIYTSFDAWNIIAGDWLMEHNSPGLSSSDIANPSLGELAVLSKMLSLLLDAIYPISFRERVHSALVHGFETPLCGLRYFRQPRHPLSDCTTRNWAGYRFVE